MSQLLTESILLFGLYIEMVLTPTATVKHLFTE